MKRKGFLLKGTIFGVFILSLILSTTVAFGATFCVKNATELQFALTTAASNTEDDTIQIVQGTYNGNFTYASYESNSLTVEGGYTSDCASRTIDPGNTVLDGGGADNVLALVSQGAANFSVEGLTLQNGNASTVDYGGGLYAKTTDGNVTLTDNTFTGNTALYQSGGAYVSGSATLTNNTFSGNTGGGVYVNTGVSGGSATLTNNTFSGNTGGGAYVNTDVSGGSATLTNNTFSGNTGGGAYVSGYNVILTDNTFTGNTGGGNGGGAFIAGAGGATLTNNTFTGNTGYDGGGAYVVGSATLINNTFTGNIALYLTFRAIRKYFCNFA